MGAYGQEPILQGELIGAVIAERFELLAFAGGRNGARLAPNDRIARLALDLG